MLDELLDMLGGGDDDDERRQRRDRPARQGGIWGFIGRLFGTDDDDEAPADTREARRRDRGFDDGDDDDDDYERAGRRGTRRDRDDDGGWFDFGD